MVPFFPRFAATFCTALIVALTFARAHAVPAPGYEPLTAFESAANTPYAALCLAEDGNLYGTMSRGGAYDGGTLYKINPATGALTTVLSFTRNDFENPGSNPIAGLVSDGQGYLWGTTGAMTISSGVYLYERGGDYGTVFKYHVASGKLTTVHKFPLGIGPAAPLTSDGAGNFWGTLYNGGAPAKGSIFKINSTSGELTSVVEFTRIAPIVGERPNGRLADDGLGFLWGTTLGGGSSSGGTLFKVNIATGELITVQQTNPLGSGPSKGLVSDGSGFLWGVMTGANSVFKIDASTGVFTTVASFTFDGDGGYSPGGALVQDDAGFFWGTTTAGGLHGRGSIFKIDAATGILTTVAALPATAAAPYSPLVSDGVGSFWCTSAIGGSQKSGTIYKVAAASGELTTLFDVVDEPGMATGLSPRSGLTRDNSGALWGTTYRGGANKFGTVFKLDPISRESTTVLSFSMAGPGNRGANPNATLVDDGTGYLWGSTFVGGIDAREMGAGFLNSYGTVFKINPATGELATVVDFTGTNAPNYGMFPYGALVSDGAGSLWGTTDRGGHLSAPGATDNGTVFKIDIATGILTTVVSFDGSANGAAAGGFPRGGLLNDGMGFMWGTTSSGGSTTAINGTIFKVNISNSEITTVIKFPNGNGIFPLGGLVDDGAGYLWGTTSRNSTANGPRFGGTVFKLNKTNGDFTTVFELPGTAGANSGETPAATLVNDGVGYLWGTASMGGEQGYGTIFRIQIATSEVTTYASFTGGFGTYPGANPLFGSLYLHPDGKFYGVTSAGGVTATGEPAGSGQVFRFTPDYTTEAPVLLSPASDSTQPAVFTVSYQLPEDGVPGSGQLIFDDGVGTVRTLTLSAARLAADSHTITLDAADLTAQPGDIVAVTGGDSLPGGTYTITLRYADSHSNAVASVAVANVILDATPPDTNLTETPAPFSKNTSPSFSFTATGGDRFEVSLDGADFSAATSPHSVATLGEGSHTFAVRAFDTVGNPDPTPASYTWIVDTTAPSASVPPLTLYAQPVGYTTIGDLRSRVTASDSVTATGNLSITQSLSPTSTALLGPGMISFTVTDQAGNAITIETPLNVVFPPVDPPGQTVVAVRAGVPAPASGSGDVPQGALLSSFGPPSVSDFRTLVARAVVTAGRQKLAAIYTKDNTGLADIPAIQNGGVPGPDGRAQTGLTFKSFLDPLIAPSGCIAFAATVQGAKSNSDQGVWTNTFGFLAEALREGAQVPGLPAGVKLKSITSLAVRDAQLIALVKLVPARGLVTVGKDDTALISLDEIDSGTLLLRTSAAANGIPGIKTISTLAPALGSPGQGRWSGAGDTLAKVTLTTGEVRILVIAADGTPSQLLSTSDPATPIHSDARWKKFGVPAMAPHGGGFAVQSTLEPKLGGVTLKDDIALLYSADGIDWEVFARKGRPAPIAANPAKPNYASFFDPVSNSAGYVAFLATLQGGDVKSANKTALFTGTIDNLSVVARLGTFAPDEVGQPNGGTWSKFTSYALTSGAVPGLVLLGEATGSSLPKFKQALWATDSNGLLRRILRTGIQLSTDGPAIKTLTLLNAVPGSPGTTHSYSETASVAVLVTFTDKSQSLLRLDLP